MGQGPLDFRRTEGLHQFSEGKKAGNGRFNSEAIAEDLHPDVKGGEDQECRPMPQSSPEDHKIPSHN